MEIGLAEGIWCQQNIFFCLSFVLLIYQSIDYVVVVVVVVPLKLSKLSPVVDNTTGVFIDWSVIDRHTLFRIFGVSIELRTQFGSEVV